MAVKFQLLGDHSAEHCGCQAVTQAIVAALKPHGVLVGPKDDFDCLIVNGEGSMHHGRRTWLTKMDAIRKAQAQGKRTWLINSVCDSNPGGYDDCLRALDDLWVRGVASAADLQQRHGLLVRHRLDLSFDCPIDENAPLLPVAGQIAVTDAYAEGFGFVWLPHKQSNPWTRIDMRQISWSTLVRSLRGVRLLIAGRHHAMYAACKARVPFIPVQGNSHKIEDLLESAACPIPIARSLADLDPLIKWAESNRSVYDALFDWMDAQPAWRFGHAEAEEPLTEPRRRSPSLVDRAMDMFTRRDYAEAYPLWRQLWTERGHKIPYPRFAATVFAESGDVDLAIQILATARERKPASITFTKQLMVVARRILYWIDRDTGPAWWNDMKEAAFRARVFDVAMQGELTRLSLKTAAEAQGAIFASSARFMFARHLVSINRHDAAMALYNPDVVPNVPDWIEAQERILLFASCRRFDPVAIAVMARAPDLECWADAAFRAIVFRHRLMTEGAEGTLLAEILESARQFPNHAELRELLYAVASEANDWSWLEPDLSGTGSLSRAALLAAAERSLGVAAFLLQGGHADTPEIRERAALLAEFHAGRVASIDLLADKKLRIAIVGNSPSALGQGLGAQIDGYEKILRFNDFSTAPAFAPDYGQRTDIHVQTYPLTAESLAKAGGKDVLIVQRHAFTLFEPRYWSPVLQAFAQGQRFGYLPRDAFAQAAAVLGTSPSAGLTLALLMKSLRGKVDRGDFDGLSMVDQLQGAPKAHYFNDEAPSLLHDWEREARSFEALFS